MAEQQFTIEELEQEEWRAVGGLEGWYSISNLGRVRREKPAKGTYVGRILKGSLDTYGYPSVRLCRKESLSNEQKSYNIHLLVSRAFLGPKPEGCEVNHKDGDKLNPRTLNLEYVTHQGNMEHASRTGLFKHSARGDNNGARLYPEKLKRGTAHHAHLKPESYSTETHGIKCRRRLSVQEVLEIRRLGDNKLLPRREIQKQFSVSETTVKLILGRYSHKNL
jgi:HNH endonuclease/NUMOD4 motif-containing protein